MENPARELAAILDGWAHGGGKNPSPARAEYARKKGMTEAQVVRQAMACIAEIGDRLEALRERGFDMSPFDAGLPQWQRGLVAAISNERATAQEAKRPAIPAEHLNLLKGLAILIDSSAMSQMPRPGAVLAVEAAISEAEAFVRATDIRDDIREYLLRLLARIRSALRDGRAADLQSAVHEYIGATVVLEEGAATEQKAGWAKAREQLLYPMLAGAGGNVLSTGVMLLTGLAGQS